MLSIAIFFGIFTSALTIPHQRVTSILVEPFLMLKGDHASHEGNDKYEGFAKDLADKLAIRLNFTYTLTFVASNKHGRFIHGRWTGIMGELEEGGADMAISPLTITKDRRRIVDFSTPFLEFQLALITRKAGFDTEGNRLTPNVTDLYANETANQRSLFLRPFSALLWIILLNTLSVLILIYLTMEFFISPQKSKASTSGKALQSVYWTFVTLILISYAASFASLRMTEPHQQNQRSIPSIKSLADLVGQSEVHFGTIRAGSTFDYFRILQDRIHKKIYAAMTGEKVTTLSLTMEDGVARVRYGLQPYALILESPYAEYHATREPCNIDVSPKYFGPHKAFAVATIPNHTLTTPINIEIVSMKESGELYSLEQKWLRTKSPVCEAIDKQHSEEEMAEPLLQLGIDELWIPFFLMAITLIFIPLIAITELNFAERKNLNPNQGRKNEEALELEGGK